MRWCSVVATATCFSVLLAITQSECPNGCSGNGDCMAKDMCNCYKNFEGNDCADRTCLFGYAHVDTPKGDINMDQLRDTEDWILVNSQRDPAGTYEYFNPNATDDEAHFYMECSNKGLCDRTTGLCACFDGYEGNGCQRTTCPNKCNEHGTCESIRELGAKAGGTLFGRELPAGSVIYDLWDGNSTYGCRCDPWFFGPDCGKRNCKVGVDPLYLSVGTALTETFVIHAYATTALGADAWIRLRVFDYYGEAYITMPIPVTGTAADDAAAVTAAFLAIPNLTFREITCDTTALSGSELAGYQSVPAVTTAGMSVTCQFEDNPGKMRIPEVASYDLGDAATTGVVHVSVVTTSQQGQDDEWFTTETTMMVDAAATTGTTVQLVAGMGTPSSIVSTAPQLFKVGHHILLGTASDDTAMTITLKYNFNHTLGSNEPIFAINAPTGPTSIQLLETDAITADVAVGDDFLTFAHQATVSGFTDAAHALVTGDTIFFENAFFSIQQVVDDGTNIVVTLDKPFGGNSLDGTLVLSTGTPTAYKLDFPNPRDVTKIYNYVSECSGRGLCGYDTGICTCFKGYTNDNCNTQNILAL